MKEVQMSARKNWQRLGAVAISAGLVLVAAACGSDDETDTSSDAETRVFSADNGEITIPVDPQRVVATGYAVPALIEADASLVGISTWERGLDLMSDEDLATYEGIEKIAGETAVSTNYEAIANVRPDLIVIGVPAPVLSDVDMEQLSAIAPVVAIGPTVPSAWRELTRRQMDAAGRTDTYEASKQAYEEKAAALKDKYAGVLGSLQFGHVGGYGDFTAGNFMREFGGSWGTNIAQDIGVNYYGEVKENKGGSGDVSEYPSVEEIGSSFAEADVITYTVGVDGQTDSEVQYVLDTELFKNLPAAQAGRVYGLQYTEAATYDSAMLALDAIDAALAPLLEPAPSAAPAAS
jgi:iron complex transport system substrate-binding protein